MPLEPDVSIVIASYNCAAYLAHAIKSGLDQTGVLVEVIVVDDCSTDDSYGIAQQLAVHEPRLKLIRSCQNVGPAAARNLALRAARGRWIAILDSDDLMHPSRLRCLLEEGERAGLDIIADNQLIFHDTDKGRANTLLPKNFRGHFDVSPERFIDANCLYGRTSALGYLKPVFRASSIKTKALVYDESLRIGEDYDIIVRALLQGMKFRVVGNLHYFYRKRDDSISHRLRPSHIEALLAADDKVRRIAKLLTAPITRALNRRRRSLERALSFDELVHGIKHRSLSIALSAAVRSPSSVLLLRLPLVSAIQRKMRGKGAERGLVEHAAERLPRIVFLSRQRIVGFTNGSSAYALSVLAHLQKRGHEIHYVCPSPSVFGSWPIIRLGAGTDVFTTVQIRGGLKIGRWIIALSLKPIIRAALQVCQRVMSRLRPDGAVVFRKAPYAISELLTDADAVFISRAARPFADAVMFDYAFLAEARPYLVSPDARAAIMMHDLFSARASQFAATGSQDTVASITFSAEIALLAKADAVIAIQGEEAAKIEPYLPNSVVIVAPMAVPAAAAPSSGDNDRVLFVGSKTAPNVDGMSWFLSEVWPEVLIARPRAELHLVGTVCSEITALPAGVTLHGLVPNLAPHYEKASVVVSPLRVGSGLKIKLIEALAAGKACLVTSTTCQGVQAQVAGAVVVEDRADAQAVRLIKLLSDRRARTDLGMRALLVARQYFGPDVAYGDIAKFYQNFSGKENVAREPPWDVKAK